MNTYGLLGEKLGHSLSPKIHRLIFQYTELKGEYTLYPVNKAFIPAMMEKVRKGVIKGLNVTIPYKSEVIKYLDGISEESKVIDAVNTIYVQNGKLVGANTDNFGFKRTLILNDIDIENKNVAILGTGGASKSIVFVIKHMGAAVVDLFSRTPKDGQKGYDELDKNHKYDVIVNTTPVGMYPDINNSPIKRKCIGNAKSVVDIIYNPTETKLLAYAKEMGIQYVNGMYMLVAQAVKAQEIFNSIKIDDSIIKKIYNDIVGGVNG